MNQLMWNIYFAGTNLIRGFVNFEGEPNTGSVLGVLQSLQTTIEGYVRPIAFIGIIVCAIGMMICRKKGKQEAFDNLLYVLIGLGIALGATWIYTLINNTVSGLSTL